MLSMLSVTGVYIWWVSESRAMNPTSLQFAVQHRDEIFPGVPVVSPYVHASRVDGKQTLGRLTGVAVSVGIRETLEFARTVLSPARMRTPLGVNDTPERTGVCVTPVSPRPGHCDWRVRPRPER